MDAVNDNCSSRDEEPLSDGSVLLLIVEGRAYDVALIMGDEVVISDAPDDLAPCDADLFMRCGSIQLRLPIRLVDGMSSTSHVVRAVRRSGAR